MIKDVIISNSNYIVVDNFLESDKFFEIRNLYDNTSLHNSNTYFNKNLYSQKSWPYIDEDVVVDNVFTSDGWKYDDIYKEDYPQCIRHFQEELITFLDVPNTTYIVSKFHEMKNNSSILWHNDSNWKYGITYYLNDMWDNNWGGELLLNDGENIPNGYGEWISPSPNRIVFVKAPLYHRTTPQSIKNKKRKSLQTFLGWMGGV